MNSMMKYWEIDLNVDVNGIGVVNTNFTNLTNIIFG